MRQRLVNQYHILGDSSSGGGGGEGTRCTMAKDYWLKWGVDFGKIGWGSSKREGPQKERVGGVVSILEGEILEKK